MLKKYLIIGDIMEWFNNLKIKSKLIIGFMLIIVMLTGMAMFAINRLNKVGVIYSNTINYPISIKDAIIKTESAFNDLRTFTNSMIAYSLQGDPEQIDIMYQDGILSYEQAVNTIQEFKNLLKANPLLNEEERSIRLEHADALDSYVRQYKNEICDPIMNAVRIGDSKQCIEILGGTKKLVDETRTHITALLDLAAAVEERTIKNALDTADQSKMLLVIISAVSIVISIILAMLIAMFITDPIRKMTDVANNVAKGNLNVIIDTSAKDETGMLAKSFSNIVNIINLLITDLKDLSKRVNAYGNLNVKLNETCFSGAYGEVVENINSFVDAALLAQESAMITVSAMFESNPYLTTLST